jgi:phospholipase/carboxylesterase
MTTAALPVRDEKPISHPSRITEKIELVLDFAQTEQPARTRSSHPHILFSPMHYEPNYAYPLLVWLHHSGEDERQIMRIMPIVSMRNYVAVAPRGLLLDEPLPPPTVNLNVSAILHRPKEHYGWTEADSLIEIEQRIFDCIVVAQERCNIAPNRIFIGGFGTGGTAALRLAMLYPEHFAGAASFGGKIPTGSRILPSWQSLQPSSVFLGVDKTAPEHTCQMMELFYTAGMTADIHEYPDTEHLTSAMLQDLNRWMMSIVCQETCQLEQ